MDENTLNNLAAARAVESQALENPGTGIPVDPDVADYMGALDDAPDDEPAGDHDEQHENI